MGSCGQNNNISVAFIDGAAVVKVEGRGSFKTSPPLKMFVHRVADDQSAKEIRIDMADCTGMDSTFMGVLAGLSCFLKKFTTPTMQVINLSEKNKKLLVTLGVDRVLNFEMQASGGEATSSEPDEEKDVLDACKTSKLDIAQTAFDAHQTLVDIHPANKSKFKSVLEYLQNDVRKLARK